MDIIPSASRYLSKFTQIVEYFIKQATEDKMTDQRRQNMHSEPQALLLSGPRAGIFAYIYTKDVLTIGHWSRQAWPQCDIIIDPRYHRIPYFRLVKQTYTERPFSPLY